MSIRAGLGCSHAREENCRVESFVALEFKNEKLVLLDQRILPSEVVYID